MKASPDSAQHATAGHALFATRVVDSGPAFSSSHSDAIKAAQRECERTVLESHPARSSRVIGRVTEEDRSFLSFKGKLFVNPKLEEKKLLPLNDAEIESHGIRDAAAPTLISHSAAHFDIG